MEENFCGCTCHPLDPEDTNIIVMNGQKWNAVCALKESVRLLAKTREELDRMKEEVEKLQSVKTNYQILVAELECCTCPICFNRVGKKWMVEQGAVCCTDCAADCS